MKPGYRPCIVGVFVNPQGALLSARRFGQEAWQLPQGGKETGETDEEAVRREMREELGIYTFTILKRHTEVIYYDFPPELQAPIAKQYKGQGQVWFLCALGPDAQPDLDKATDKEFDGFAWKDPKTVLKEITHWKKEAYQKGLMALGVWP